MTNVTKMTTTDSTTPAIARPTVTTADPASLSGKLGPLLGGLVAEYVKIVLGPYAWDTMKFQLVAQGLDIDNEIFISGVPILRNPAYEPAQLTIQFGGFVVFYEKDFLAVTA